MNTTITIPPAAQRKEPPKPPIRLEFSEDRIATVLFDRDESAANIFDSSTLRLLARLLDELGTQPATRGVIFQSAKPAIFIAGADLKELSTARNREELIELGQHTFSRIASLPCVTVAAIHGACVGGGLEMALACDYRVASPVHATRIGLPEVNLGILPAWGGSTRLPRLIGLSRAMEAIVRGEVMPAAKAKKLGLVDGLAPRERLPDLARKFIEKGKPAPHRRREFAWSLTAPVAAALARRSVRQKTRGHYPAPFAAIDVVSKSLSRGIPESLEAERKALAMLAEGDVCRNLIRAFLLQDRAKHLAAPRAVPVRNTAVIGAGVMGAGIAQWLASRGLNVLLRDIDAEQVARGLQRAGGLFAEAKKRKLMSPAEAQAGMDRLAPMDGPAPMKFVDLVIEAALERLDVKQKIFADLEQRTRPEAILATNTSALPIGGIGAVLRYPQRLVGLHFFNPVHRMQLVEIVRTEMASDVAVDTAAAFVRRIGKLPVVVRDRPGFLVNRILLPYLLEAANLFEAGASIEALDESMLDFGFPMGPMRLLDEVGLDVAADVAQTLCAAFPDRMRQPAYFGRMLEAGIRGRKGGEGFYTYRKGRAIGANLALKCFQRTRAAAGLTCEQLQQRMELLMINEAARCLEERIVAEPEDVDFAMIMGTGFAPFRGGPLRHADAVGIEKITGAMRLLADAGERHFAPCDRLFEMTAQHRSFYDN